MIEYIKKDVTAITHGVVAHGVNAQGKMGSGVALAIRERWPNVYDLYKQQCASVPRTEREILLGRCQIVCVEDQSEKLFVANLFTQLNYGYDGKAYANTYAILLALQECISFCCDTGLPLYMPRVGCGLGGLDWNNDVGPIVENLSSQYNVDVFVCDL